MSAFGFELRSAIRSLLRSPGYSLVILVTFVIGVGGTTLVFTLLHSVLLRPLPFGDPDRLVVLHPQSSMSKRLFEEIRDASAAYRGMAAWSGGARVLTGAGEPELVPGPEVSAGFLEVLGHRPALGRFLVPDDNRPGAPPVVVLTWELYRERYQADPRIVGRTVTLDERDWTVVGVLPPGAALLQNGARLVTPLEIDPGDSGYRTGFYLSIVARLAEGRTLQQARDELGRTLERLDRIHGFSDRARAGFGVESLHESLVGDRRPMLMLLMGAVGLLLAIGCVNAGNLTLARHLSRRREIAVRAALGVGRARALLGMTAETVMLAVAGGGLGSLAARSALAAIRAGGVIDLPPGTELAIGTDVLLFAFGVTTVTALAAGVVPGVRASRGAPADVLRSGRGQSDDRSTRRLRELLVVGQVAATVVLAAAAGVAGHSMWGLLRLDPGFDPERRLLLQLVPPVQGQPGAFAAASYYERLLREIDRQPEALGTGTVHVAPVRGGGWVMETEIEGTEPDPANPPLSYWRVVSTGYFDALGAALVAGRDLGADDIAGAQPVAIVNETFARLHWPGSSAVGRLLRIGFDDERWITVVGVVADIRLRGLTTDTPATVYRPLPQAAAALDRIGVTTQALVVHTREQPMDALRAIGRAIHDVDPTVAIVGPTSLEGALRDSLARPRLLLQVLASFGMAALMLSTIGVAAVVGQLVRERRFEFGIRQALGASRRQVVARAFGRGVALGGIGLIIGAAAALLAGPVLASQLYRMPARDPMSLFATLLLLLVCIAAAAWIPARRVARISPVEALRRD